MRAKNQVCDPDSQNIIKDFQYTEILNIHIL